MSIRKENKISYVVLEPGPNTTPKKVLWML